MSLSSATEIKVDCVRSGGAADGKALQTGSLVPVSLDTNRDNYNEVKSYQTTELRQNPDGSFSKITKTITSTTKTLFINSETVTNEDRAVNERPRVL